MFELYISNKQITRHAVYLDNDVFRLLIREQKFWVNFFCFFEKEDPEVFQDIEFIFTWSQVLEAVNSGKILSEIAKDDIWIKHQKEFGGKNISNMNNVLDKSCEVLLKIFQQKPMFQKKCFKAKIEHAINYGRRNQHNRILIKQTLMKARDFVDADSYMETLSYELAWLFLCAYPFIAFSSSRQYESRKLYLDALLAMGLKLHQQGHELNLYRLVDTIYNINSNIACSRETKPSATDFKLKPYSDLCDGEMVHYAGFGALMPSEGKRYPVINITMVTKEFEKSIKKYEHRISLIKQTLIDIGCDVKGWDIPVCPGEILILMVDTEDNYKVISGHKIPFNAPLKVGD